MAVNNFLVWAGGSNANVLTQAEYSAAPNLASGVVAGKASGQQANKTWRQSSVIASTIAQFIVDRTGSDVIDDGTIATIEANFIRAIQSLFVIPNTGVTPGTYGPTLSLTVEADGRVTALANANLLGTGLTPGTYVAPTITVGADGRISGITSVAYGPLASANAWTALNSYSAGVDISGYDAGGMQLRTTQGSYGAGLRNDGTSVFLLQTASGQQLGTFSALRPFAWNLSTGAVTIDGTGAGATFGGNVNFGSTGLFFAKTISGNPTFGFSSNMYIQNNLGQGITVNSTGNVIINAPTGVDVSNNLTTTGKLRSAVGAFGSADPNCAVILNDLLFNNGGNDAASFFRLPNGYIIQTSRGVNSTGADFIAFPNAFPTACIQVIACEGAPSGWSVAGTFAPTIFGTQQLSAANFALYCVKYFNGTGPWGLAGAITYRYIAIGY